MKKSLFLLPILAAAMLCSCGPEGGGGGGQGGGGGGDKSKEISSNSLKLDFVNNWHAYKEDAGWPQVSDGTPFNLELEGVNFSISGCYIGYYKDATGDQQKDWLMMGNKKLGISTTYISMHDHFKGSIKKIDFKLNGGGSAAAAYKVCVGDKEIASPSDAKDSKSFAGSASAVSYSYTVETANCHYFGIFCEGSKNGQITEISVTVE